MLLIKKIFNFLKDKGNLFIFFYCLQGAVLLIAYFLYIHISEFDFIDQMAILSRCFLYFFIEQVLFLTLLILLFRSNLWMSFLTGFLVMLFYIIQGVQFTSFTMYSDFLIKDALANFEHIGLLLNVEVVLLQVFFILMGVLTLWLLVFCKVRNWELLKRIKAIKIALLSYGGFIVVSILFLSVVNLKQEPNFPLADESRSPILAYFSTTYDFFFSEDIQSDKIDQKVISFYSPHIDVKQPYPLIKNWFYKDSLPFKRVKRSGNKNVIVFFVESLSGRNLGVYNEKLKDISPNINIFPIPL